MRSLFREEGEIGSEFRERGDLLPCSSPLSILYYSVGRVKFTLAKSVHSNIKLVREYFALGGVKLTPLRYLLLQLI